MTDNDILAGILAATEEDLMPRVVAEFDYNGQTVSIVEPVAVTDGKLTRGYLWHAIIGDFVLSPTRPGDVDPERWVPGKAELLPGGRLIAMSSKSAKAAATNARRQLAKHNR